ncbi:pyrroline-5-carboxylate reductase [Pseudoalteromonas luteoviolacea]|nr:pyrroline-5-carboxylate reductase [Pseudoalteromonas luteoviolacea]AOT10166.1 pyrroline-5-carboxylate reductase [Pseudoalteromonas luteoviolacea]AOT15078.1 pyrroline-5-carboxylate reductase [Pseudoalteromonas luteoviolacea]AOT19994.1 pyrroline-5-carboxylate reductase [Pseudoalteromonas luteoviolacea]
MSNKTIAFIGTGNMSYAIIGGMLKSGFSANNIIATNRNQEKLNKVANDFNVQTTSDNLDAITRADVIVLSVKPQMMEALCDTFKSAQIDLSQKVIVSVAAGITLSRLKEMLQCETKLVRCMPNTPSLVGLGVSGLFSHDVDEQEKAFIDQVFSATGITAWLTEESQINDIIAVTGSSPAYFFLFMQAIEEKARSLGFDEQQARLLVQQTALGAAQMAVAQPDVTLEQLRANVTSKGGTTHAAIESMKDNQLPQIVANAMDACIARAEEMETQI